MTKNTMSRINVRRCLACCATSYSPEQVYVDTRLSRKDVARLGADLLDALEAWSLDRHADGAS